jgi:hypothetical protein
MQRAVTVRALVWLMRSRRISKTEETHLRKVRHGSTGASHRAQALLRKLAGEVAKKFRGGKNLVATALFQLRSGSGWPSRMIFEYVSQTYALRFGDCDYIERCEIRDHSA